MIGYIHRSWNQEMKKRRELLSKDTNDTSAPKKKRDVQPYGNQAKLDAINGSNVVAWYGSHADTEGSSSVCSISPEFEDQAPAPTIQDGTSGQEDIVLDAVKHARKIGSSAVQHMLSDEIFTSDVFQKWFTTPSSLVCSHTSENSAQFETVKKAREIMLATSLGLKTKIPIEIDSSGPLFDDDAAGFVYGARFEWIDDIVVSSSNIHLTPKFFTLSPQQQGEVILHEATHKYARTDDYAYGKACETLDPSQSIKNADSYTQFARDAHTKQIADRKEAALDCDRFLIEDNFEQIFVMVINGEYELWTSPLRFEGVEIEAESLIARTIAEQFVKEYPKEFEEIKMACERFRENMDLPDPRDEDFTLKIGVVLPQALIQEICVYLDLIPNL